MQKTDVRKLNYAEVKKKSQVKISDRFAALEDFMIMYTLGS
jgi:hypothetical protein